MLKQLITHRELDKKTYFNALEKMLISPSKKGTVHNPTPASIFEDIMRKPPNDYVSPKIPQNANEASRKKLFDLCWYDSLIDDKNKVSHEGLPQLKFSMKRNSQQVNSMSMVSPISLSPTPDKDEPTPNSTKNVLN